MNQAVYRFSPEAESDMNAISDYSLEKWGENQTFRYLHGLVATFDRLAANPGLGRPCSELAEALRRYEHGKHVIFFRAQSKGILISRVLHQKMLPTQHAFGG